MAAPEEYKSLGKIGISYKGDYNSNTAYERLDAVYHNGSTYLAIKDAPDGAPRDDKLNWIYLAKGFSGDIGDSEIAFTEAENRENINTGESVKTVFGKIKKFFADLTAPAFAQMITSKADLLATKATGYVPDAKAVADGFADVNGKLDNIYTSDITSEINTDYVIGSIYVYSTSRTIHVVAKLTAKEDIPAWTHIINNLGWSGINMYFYDVNNQIGINWNGNYMQNTIIINKNSIINIDIEGII